MATVLFALLWAIVPASAIIPGNVANVVVDIIKAFVKHVSHDFQPQTQMQRTTIQRQLPLK